MDPIVQCHALTKIYMGNPALNGLELSLPRGKVVGLLGPNGSGKTTLIKLCAGLLTPTSGEILVDGEIPSERTKAVVSYLPEFTYFEGWMRVGYCLDMFEDFYEDFDRARAEEMLKDLEVGTDMRLRTLSKGMKEKVQLCTVMARRAKLFLLDEPIAGVDPATREYILDVIIRNAAAEATVLISTHLISDVEKILDEFVFIRKGENIFGGNAAELREQYSKSVDEMFREVFRYVY